MKEVVGDLWTYPADIRLITTNGTINSKGRVVMGRGCAKEAAGRYPSLPMDLANAVRAKGNTPIAFPEFGLITFPVKHNWYEVANIELIKTSTLLFKAMIDPALTYCLPRPGCGNGKLTWDAVREALRLIELPDNVHVITFPNEKAV